MVAGTLGAWALALPLLHSSVRLASFYGLLGPLIVTAGSWIAIERVHRTKPAAVTTVMMAGFGIKLVFVGAYVSVMLGLTTMNRMAFVVSFTLAFIALYVVEAFLLRGLMTAASGTSAQD
jgi:hypothetical protein